MFRLVWGLLFAVSGLFSGCAYMLGTGSPYTQARLGRCDAFAAECTQSAEDFDYVFDYRATDLGDGRYRISGLAKEKAPSQSAPAIDNVDVINVIFFLIKDDSITGTVNVASAGYSPHGIRFEQEFMLPQRPDTIALAGYRSRVN